MFRDDAVGVIQIKEWLSIFKNSLTSVKNDQHSEMLQTARNAVIEKGENLVKGDRSLTTQEIASEVRISKDSLHANLNMQSGCEMCVQAAVSET